MVTLSATLLNNSYSCLWATRSSNNVLWVARLTLLRHGTVVHRSCLGWVSTTAVLLLLSSVHLRMSSHRITLLRMSIGHLRHAGVLHATVATAHAKTADDSTASGRVATPGAVVRGLVDTNGTAIEPECGALASIHHELRILQHSYSLLRWSYSTLFIAAIARCASSSFV